MSGETCETEDCEGWPRFPDCEGYLYCRRCYDGPADFEHVPDEQRRDELREAYA
jgi:hypothetical protein